MKWIWIGLVIAMIALTGCTTNSGNNNADGDGTTEPTMVADVLDWGHLEGSDSIDYGKNLDGSTISYFWTGSRSMEDVYCNNIWRANNEVQASKYPIIATVGNNYQVVKYNENTLYVCNTDKQQINLFTKRQ
jgi:hypothetical protein